MQTQSKRRVVVTGMGAVTPLGNSVRDFWRRLCAGECGIATITHFDATTYQSRIAAEIRELPLPASLDRSRLKHLARFTLLSLIAAIEAWQQAGLSQITLDPYHVEVLVGTSHGGEECLLEALTHILRNEPEKVSVRLISRMLGNMATRQIARQFNLHGPGYAPAAACATGAMAIGEATEIIRRGDATIHALWWNGSLYYPFNPCWRSSCAGSLKAEPGTP